MMITLGEVVHFVGKRRRYVVVSANRWGKLQLSALSGGMPGCHGSDVNPARVEHDEDQSLGAHGKEAAFLQRRYQEVRGRCLSWGQRVAECPII